LVIEESLSVLSETECETLSEGYIAQRIAAGSNQLHAEVIAAIEHKLLTQVLKHTSGNQLKASSILGISRVTLRSKLKSLGIDASSFSN